MKRINLTQGKYALVDDSDFEWLSQWKWTYLGTGTNHYAYRGLYEKGKRVGNILMHVQIMGKSPAGYEVDHRDRNGLNNTRSNLRFLTRTENNYNTRELHSNNTSGRKGISWCKRTNRWRVYIGGVKSRVELGRYKSFNDAVSARKKAEKEVICLV